MSYARDLAERRPWLIYVVAVAFIAETLWRVAVAYEQRSAGCELSEDYPAQVAP